MARKLTLVAVLLIAAPLWATQYYIDNCVNTGSDSYDGTEQVHTTGTTGPWLTIAHAEATIAAGDTVSLRGGCVWREAWLPATSGTLGNLITYNVYGTGNAIIDGATILAHWQPGGGTWALQDTFESGSYNGQWSSTQGSVGTCVSFSITCPVGGGSYVATLASSQQSNYDSIDSTDACAETWVRSGSSTAARSYVMQFGNGSTPYIQVAFGASTDATPNVLRVFDSPTSTAYYGTITISASTWYKVKSCVYANSSAGWVNVWLDSGSGYQLEVSKGGINTGSAHITRVSMGYGVSGQTTYYDFFQLSTADPNTAANTYFATMAGSLTAVPPTVPARIWTGPTTVDPKVSDTEVAQNAGAYYAITANQWDTQYCNCLNSSVIWVNVGGSPSNVELASIQYPLRTGASYRAWTGDSSHYLVFEHAQGTGFNVGRTTPSTNLTLSYIGLWDNNGSGFYVDKNAPIQGADSISFDHISASGNHWGYGITVPPPSDWAAKAKGGHGMYWTKLTNSTASYIECWNNNDACIQNQDASNSNTIQYMSVTGGTWMVTDTTDTLGGSSGLTVANSVGIGLYECMRATSPSSSFWYNNTCLNYTHYGLNLNTTNYGTFKNNIFYSSGVPAIHADATAGLITSDYNDWGPESANYIQIGASNYSTLAAWPGHGAHDTAANPQTNYDGSLSIYSPMINAGVNLGAYTSGLNPGSTGNSYYGIQTRSNWDIGAFVFNPIPVAGVKR